MSDQAILRFAAPGNCFECQLVYNICDRHGQFEFRCGKTRAIVGGYAKTRHPDCPLKIVTETPETPEGELKTCPFCGCRAAELLRKVKKAKDGHPRQYFAVFCNDCNVRTPWYEVKENAIAAWNMREDAK